MTEATTAGTQKGFLGFVETTGNKLPDPVFLFFYLIGGLVLISIICAAIGVSAPHPTQLNPDGSTVIVRADSLLSAAKRCSYCIRSSSSESSVSESVSHFSTACL